MKKNWKNIKHRKEFIANGQASACCRLVFARQRIYSVITPLKCSHFVSGGEIVTTFKIEKRR